MQVFPRVLAYYLSCFPCIRVSMTCRNITRDKTTLFADDTLFYATNISNNSAANKLQKQLDLAVPWFHRWQITINSTKTTAILFSNRSTYNTNKIILKGIAHLFGRPKYTQALSGRPISHFVTGPSLNSSKLLPSIQPRANHGSSQITPPATLPRHKLSANT